jgi:hypothetical protein
MPEQARDLMLQVIWEPHVVGVQECHQLSIGFGNPQIAGGAHAAVGVTRMRQVAHLAWMTSQPRLGHSGAVVG